MSDGSRACFVGGPNTCGRHGDEMGRWVGRAETGTEPENELQDSAKFDFCKLQNRESVRIDVVALVCVW